MADFDLSNFIASFFDEARERLNSINQHLVDFEAGTLAANGLIDLRRDAHTIKGSALMLGVKDVGAISHIFEDMMEELIEHPEWRTPRAVQFLYDLHDMLDVRLQDPESENLLDPTEKEAEYKSILDELKGGQAAANPADQVPQQHAVQPIYQEPHNLDPAPLTQFESTHFEPAPLESAHFEPAHFEPAPLESAPLESAHFEPAHFEPAPLESAPLESAHFEPEPLVSTSLEDYSLSSLPDENHQSFADDDFNLSDIPLLSMTDDAVALEGETELGGFTDFNNDLDPATALDTDFVLADLEDALEDQQDVFVVENAASFTSEAQPKIEAQARVEDTPPPSLAPIATAEQQPEFVSDNVVNTTANATSDVPLTSEFRPEIIAEKKKGSGQRKTSGRFLRVDAERLEDLSHHIIEMSTEQSRVSKSESDLGKTQLELRAIRREMRKMQHMVESQPAAKASLENMAHMLDVHMRQIRRMNEEARYQSERSSLVLRELRDQVLSLMLRPLDSIFSTFPRAVRDVASRIGKRVRLVVDGKTVEMDQSVAESLVEPLVHLLNNAVAHGIEDNAERVRLGKPEEGQVTITAHQNGNEVRIEVMDDGRGIDTKVIKRVAVERGVTTQDEADLMDSAEILEMIFRPGFSTMDEVGSLAGRGIGMNVVQDTVRRLTGSIRIHTELGKGSRFVISVPVSVAVQQALMFTIGDQQYGMLTHMIEQAVPYNKQKIEKGVGGKQFLSYESHQVPIVDLRMMMLKKGSVLSENPYIIVSEHIEGYVGIVVDDLLGDGEIVVRNLDPYIKRYQPQGLMGNTIIDDGTVVMLLEPYGIKEMGRTSPDQHIEIDIEEEQKLNFSILLVDDSLIAREIERSIFESLGFTVETAIDGMDGLDKLAAGEYDMIITDLEMPRLDGFGFVRQIRNQPEYEDMPVMVISTRESAEDRMRALEAGADSYMVKQHLDGDSILSTVQALVGPLVAKQHGVEHQPSSQTP